MSEAVRLIKLGRRAEQRGKVLKGCLKAAFDYVAFTIALRALFLMWAVDVADGVWHVGTIGYWSACLLTVFLTPFLPSYSSRRTKDGAS